MNATDGLHVTGIAKSFSGVQALNEISLAFPAGTVTALMGENGAGKSTLLKIVCGDQPADSGTIRLDGTPLHLHSPADARAAGIRLIPQEPEIVPHISVAENVYLGALPTRGARRFDRAGLRRRLEADLVRIGFDKVLDADTLGIDLTAAQRQLVEILRALTGEAKVVAFDEPTSSLSEHEVEALFALIRRLRESGLAVVYVSHRMQEIFQLADRIAVLRDGTLVGVKDAAATDQREIVRMMVGRDLSSLFTRAHVATDRVVLDVQDVTTDDVTGITLQVRAGEVVALAGLVGAGRSELARALVGDLPLRGGSVSVGGRVLRLRRPSDAIRAGLGLAPEERKAQALFLNRSIRDNTALVVLRGLRRLRFVRRGAERKLAQEFADRLRVRAPSIEHEVRTLSGGNQQKVVLARWLARRPSVLILDEPTRGIDVGAKAEIYQIIADLAESGVALLVISSELPEVLGLADRVLVMQGGRITGELPRAEATEEGILALAMADGLATAGAHGTCRRDSTDSTHRPHRPHRTDNGGLE
ncbi:MULTISPECIES: sugar ABC transporter ATP-binding protein [unclassified Streptomyces]|uniref:sugar ABC transporter ATP-binding protein n=1 Tax=unclassified Streptomyces TaxID=2593676 RepID=UPI001BEAD16E|nr:MULTISPECIES: sugar ABC transporter ATP-binding protein [unclassified Streptomyces]MBT2406204.1 sugar ABC transporter ATP-binding protein [Streptomyces sp. ISL-21]MBT2609504.1 sugar ABC transporter ATP-binding protein [Streptomyces sp. ISL-87]